MNTRREKLADVVRERDEIEDLLLEIYPAVPAHDLHADFEGRIRAALDRAMDRRRSRGQLDGVSTLAHGLVEREPDVVAERARKPRGRFAPHRGRAAEDRACDLA